MTSGKRPSRRKYEKQIHSKEQDIGLEEHNSEDYLIFYKQGMYYSRYRECDRAIERFTEAIRLNPNIVDAFYQRGFMYHYRCTLQGGDKSDLDLAVIDFTQAIQLDPRHYYAYDHRIMTNMAKHAFDEIILDCNTVMRGWPYDDNFAMYSYMAFAYEQKKDYHRAADIYHARSMIYMERAEYDSVFYEAIRMIEIAPTYFRGYVVIGDACHARGDLKGAIDNYQKALVCYPSSAELRLKLSELKRQDEQQ